MIAHVWETAETPPAATDNMIGMCVSKLSDGAYTASELAQAAYATLDGRPDGQRTLFLRHCGEKRTGVANLKPDTYYDFMVNGARADEWRAFMSDYWVAWAQSGDMRPSRIVLEFEQHYEWYAITGTNADRAALVQSVRDAGYKRRYPAAFNAFTEAQLAAHSNAKSPTMPAISMHDLVVKQRMNAALGEVAIGTYATILGGPIPPASNYGDLRLRAPFTSPYEYTYPVRTTCAASDSSPALYFTADAGRYSTISGSAAKQFAAMKGMIERVRAIRGPIVPWVGPPGYRGDGFTQQTSPTAWVGWRKFIHTLSLHGISEVLYFIGNYVHETGEREYADETFATAPSVVTKRAIDRYATPTIDTNSLYTGTSGYVLTEFPYNSADWT